jgi:hypothetical protein
MLVKADECFVCDGLYRLPQDGSKLLGWLGQAIMTFITPRGGVSPRGQGCDDLGTESALRQLEKAYRYSGCRLYKGDDVG